MHKRKMYRVDAKETTYTHKEATFWKESYTQERELTTHTYKKEQRHSL